MASCDRYSPNKVIEMKTWEKNLNALQAIIIAGVLLGAFTIQYFKQEEPCPLCLLQRLGMMGVAAGALMNCKFGPRKMHYGLSLISVIFGGFVALRQICLHICPGFPTFGIPLWGLSLYTWSFLVFACSVAYIGLLLLIFDHSDKEEGKETINWWSHLAFALTLLVSLGNVIYTFYECGLTACRI